MHPLSSGSPLMPTSFTHPPATWPPSGTMALSGGVDFALLSTSQIYPSAPHESESSCTRRCDHTPSSSTNRLPIVAILDPCIEWQSQIVALSNAKSWQDVLSNEESCGLRGGRELEERFFSHTPRSGGLKPRAYKPRTSCGGLSHRARELRLVQMKPFVAL